ncbi:MAG: aldehyde dehydrogenase family protein [Nitrososphaerota archaeon]|nr:aldehyde dehydrogenase family protein [Nitrososphaerota archaeon]MDG6939160.1 aldehyde dehydrogenase family protein [Nitrososphaerota archaeon]
MQSHVETFHNFVGGRWVPSAAGETYELHDPADASEAIGRFQGSGVEDARAAIAAAQEAFAAWRSTPAPQRGQALFRAWSLMKERVEEFARTITKEEGKPIADARGEVKRALNVLEFTAGEGRRLLGDTIPSELPKTLIYTQRRPLGVTAVITPWNFPLAIPVWKVAPALVSGNTVVFKPASSTPLTAIALVKVFVDAGLPAGVLNMVTGPGATVGKELATNPSVRAISFTGSTETGRWIYGAASGTLKKVQCEMGGKNAVVVAEDADLDLAVEGVVQGAFGSSGQRCTATSRVVVLKGAKGPFMEKLAARTTSLKVGPGLDARTDVGPLSSREQLDKVMGHIALARKEGARLVAGGRRMAGGHFDGGFYVEPTIFDGVEPGMSIAQQEIFGPVLAVLEAEDMDEAMKLANDSLFGLSGSIYTSDLAKAMKYAEEAEAGMLHINSPTLGGEAHVPFGGLKQSGLGIREQGRRAIEFFTEEVVVYMDYTGKKRDARFI